MPIYEKSTKDLLHDWAAQNVTPGQVFEKGQVIDWFATHYPKLNQITVGATLDTMSVNAQTRMSNSIRANTGYDLFFKVGRSRYRLWDPATDPAPMYPGEPATEDTATAFIEATDDEDAETEGTAFALEVHLQDYLIKNLGQIEKGLVLYEDEGLTGREFPADNRRIDILAVDAQGGFVVIETKVGKAYDRVIGQTMFYKNWVAENLADGKPVRAIIVGSEISPSLKLATKGLPDIELIEYEISFSMRRVSQ